MKLSLHTYNGSTIGTTTYKARIPGDDIGLDADLISAPRVNDTVAYGGKSFRPTEFDLLCVIASTDGTARESNKETLGALFNTKNSTLGTLVALDTNDSSRQYYINCTVENAPVIKGETLTVKMWSPDPVWKKVSSTAGTITVLAGAGTTTMVNGGNVDTFPSISIQPTSTVGAYAYRQHIIIYNPTDYAFTMYPIDVTAGGINTGALVGDTTVTNQVNVVGGISGTATAWAVDTGVGGGLPAAGGYFYMDAEQCSYTANSGGSISGVIRGINGTTAGTHAENTVMKRSLLQADGDDIVVSDSGNWQPRWFGGAIATTSTCKVWVPLSFAAKIEIALGEAIGASGATAITFKDKPANVKLFKRLPYKGLLVIDSEVIAYTAKNAATLSLTIADTGRGLKDTTPATHARGVTVRWLEHDLVLIYGNPLAVQQDYGDTYKPSFSLANSTNTNWRYDSADSVFGSLSGLRTGGWTPTRPKGNYSVWYTGGTATLGTDPFTAMGGWVVPYQSGAIWKAETAQICWTLYNPAGFTSVSLLGQKYKALASTAWPKTRLSSSVDGVSWTVEWTEATPSSATSWEAWTHAGEAVPAGTKWLRFETSGATNAVADNGILFEANLGAAGSSGVSMESTGVPQITVGARQTNAHVSPTITNTTTGEYLTYSHPMAASSDVLTIDTANRLVSFKDSLLAPPGLSTVRQEWLRMVQGNNVITYSDSQGGNATVIFTWNDRKNI